MFAVAFAVIITSNTDISFVKIHIFSFRALQLYRYLTLEREYTSFLKLHSNFSPYLSGTLEYFPINFARLTNYLRL